MRYTSILALSGLALVLFACSSEAPTSSVKGPSTAAQNDDDDDDKASSKPGNTASNDPASSSDPTDPAPAGGGQCASQAKADACFDCCDPTQTAFEAADQDYGGLDPYLREGLGLGEPEMERLKELYLPRSL